MAEDKSTHSPTTVESDNAIFRPVLGVLLRAFDYARDVEADLWSFAVEITSLRDLGVTETVLRWLAARGYVEHRLETSVPGDENRSFRPAGRFGFAESSCFVLTASGEEFARAAFAGRNGIATTDRGAEGVALGGQHAEVHSASAPSRQSANSTGTGPKLRTDVPVWDPLRRELRVGDRVVKRFRLPSANQETLLTAFEENSWPPRIDDPLPPLKNRNPKTRLRNAIKGLNRHQRHRLIRFMGDETGEAVLWEFVPWED